jgi:cytochrome c-type biogenesis protein CcmH/NrfF
VCQDLSVADSPAALAEEMRTTIAEKLQAGETPDQIRAGFVGAYGQWILLAPTHRGLNLVAWIAPVLLLVGGLLLAVTSVRRWSAGSAGRVVGEPDPTRQEYVSGLPRDDRMLLDRAILRVKDEPD